MFYIPIDDSELSSEVVKKCLKTIKSSFVLVISHNIDYPSHREAIARNREKIFRQSQDEFIVCCDSRVEHLKNDNYDTLIKYLKENSKCGGVSISRNKRKRTGHAPHMGLECFAVRAALVQDWEYKLSDGCNCKSLNKHIRDKQYTFDLLEQEPGRIIKHPH